MQKYLLQHYLETNSQKIITLQLVTLIDLHISTQVNLKLPNGKTRYRRILWYVTIYIVLRHSKPKIWNSKSAASCVCSRLLRRHPNVHRLDHHISACPVRDEELGALTESKHPPSTTTLENRIADVSKNHTQSLVSWVAQLKGRMYLWPPQIS